MSVMAATNTRSSAIKDGNQKHSNFDVFSQSSSNTFVNGRKLQADIESQKHSVSKAKKQIGVVLTSSGGSGKTLAQRNNKNLKSS
jgi:hypothetical protein